MTAVRYSPQQAAVLSALKVAGWRGLSKLEGPRTCGVLNVSDCVMNLRRKGWQIETRWVEGENRFGPYKYARYVLTSKRRKAA